MDQLFLAQITNTSTRGQIILDICFFNIEDIPVQAQEQETIMLYHKLVVIKTLYSVDNDNHHEHLYREGLHEKKFQS